MQWLATFVMRGRVQAASVTAAFAVVPLLSWFSGAAVGLVTLRRGPAEGFLILAIGGLLLFALGQIGAAGGIALALTGLVYWIPVAVLATVLRSTRSLALALETGMLVAVAALLVQYLISADPVAFWQEALKPLADSLVEGRVLPVQDADLIAREIAAWMPGMISAALFMQAVISLLIGRWWQALLYNPGGFRSEFHALRLSRLSALVVAPLMILLLTGLAGGFWRHLAMIGVAAYFVQGLALAHGMLGLFKAHSGWLVGIYVLLFIATPYAVAALTAAGYADAWMDFRARARARNAKSE